MTRVSRLNPRATTADVTYASLASPAALRTWHAALGNRFYAPAKIVAMGSSTVEGQGATVWGRHLMVQLVNRLRGMWPTPGVAGGVGFICPALIAAGVGSYPAALGGGAAIDTTTTVGWAARTVHLLAGGDTITYTIPSMTSFEIMYGQFGSAGVFSYSIDGGTAVNVNGSNATLDRFKSTGKIAVTRGAHTVTIAYVSTNPSYIRGLMVYDQDETSGINMYEGGHAGYTSTQYVAINAQTQYGITQIQPHLVLIDIGRNDYTTQTVTPAQLQANVLSLIAMVRANCATNPSIALYMTQALSGAVAGTQWNDYRTVYQSIAGSDPGVCIFDLALRQTVPLVDNTLGLYNVDITHLSDKGDAAVADQYARFLSPQ